MYMIQVKSIFHAKPEEQFNQEIEEKCARQFLQEIPKWNNAKEENKSKIPLK